MKRSWFPVLLVAGLLGLLIVLAFFQYRWLEKISADESERMHNRVKTDTERFAEDFNREIQNAYFNFQTETEAWKQKNWTPFNERYDFWRERSNYPELIKNFYYWDNLENAPLLKYDAEKRAFTETVWSDDLKKLQTKIVAARNSLSFQPENFALVIPIQEVGREINRILIRQRSADKTSPPIRTARKIGFLVITLDENTVKNRLLPDLTSKYFGSGEFDLAVRARDGQTFYQTKEINAADASAALFSVSPDNFLFFSNRQTLLNAPGREVRSMLYSRTTNKETISRIATEAATSETQREKINELIIKKINEKERAPAAEKNTKKEGALRFVIAPQENPLTASVKINAPENAENWTIDVQHAAGSLEQYISNTRRKDLALGFGILSLLAISIILIFVSTQRAKLLARRQIEFVSSVSHEFRTPLAVIYSASENLADGVAKEPMQISRYGNLIKNEGKKLSAMVEQILAFAGANSGKRKYDLRETDAREIIDAAIEECRSLIEEKNFTIEREISENLPPIVADKIALSGALQNLIANSIKYSNGSNWLKISAKNGDKTIKIAVEDRGFGIAAKDLKHVFEPFYRAKSVVDRQIHGNGLGLSLVKQTVEAHSGKVSVESEPKKGSKFTITLKI